MKKFLGCILVFLLFTFFSSSSFAAEIISPPNIVISPSIVPPTNTPTVSLPTYGVGITSPTFIPSLNLPIGIFNPIPIQLPSTSFPSSPQPFYSYPNFYPNSPNINDPDFPRPSPTLTPAPTLVPISIPHVTNITPKSGTILQTITITGVGFGASRGLNSVVFSKYGSAEIISWSNTEITLKVPLIKQRGAYSVWIEKSVEASIVQSNKVGYEVTVAQPFITRVSAANFKSNGTITITGTEFTKNIGRVTVSKYVNYSPQLVGQCTVNSWTNTSIKCKLPDKIDKNSEYLINVSNNDLQSPPRFIYKGKDSDCSITGCG